MPTASGDRRGRAASRGRRGGARARSCAKRGAVARGHRCGRRRADRGRRRCGADRDARAVSARARGDRRGLARVYPRVQLDFAASRLAAARTDAEARSRCRARRCSMPTRRCGSARCSRSSAAVRSRGRRSRSRSRSIPTGRSPSRVLARRDRCGRGGARARAPVRTRSRSRASRRARSINVDGRDAGRTSGHRSTRRPASTSSSRARRDFGRCGQAFAVAGATPRLELALERDEVAAVLAGGAVLGLPDAAAQDLVDAVLELADLGRGRARRRGRSTRRSDAAGPALRRAHPRAARPWWRSATPTRRACSRRRARCGARCAPPKLRYPPSVFGDPRVTAPRVVAQHCQLCRSPYLWGGIGAALVAGAIAAIVLVNETSRRRSDGRARASRTSRSTSCFVRVRDPPRPADRNRARMCCAVRARCGRRATDRSRGAAVAHERSPCRRDPRRDALGHEWQGRHRVRGPTCGGRLRAHARPRRDHAVRRRRFESFTGVHSGQLLYAMPSVKLGFHSGGWVPGVMSASVTRGVGRHRRRRAREAELLSRSRSARAVHQIMPRFAIGIAAALPAVGRSGDASRSSISARA